MINICNTDRLVGWVALLVFCNISCLKPVDIAIDPQQDFLIYGNMSNTKSFLSILGLQGGEVQELKNARIYVNLNTTHHEFKLKDDRYELAKYIPPNTNYELIVDLNNKQTIFKGQLPDTVRKAELSLHQIKDFKYQFWLDVEVGESEEEYGYLWGLGSNDNLAYERDFLERFATDQFFVAKTNPLSYNKDFTASFQRVYAKTLDGYKVLLDNWENRLNPLYIKYNPNSDVVVNNILFRINEITNIHTNTVRIEDDTPILIACSIYLEGKKELTPSVYKELEISIKPLGTNKSVFIPVNPSNPTTVSLNQMAPLIAEAAEDDLVFEDILTKPFHLIVQGVDLDGKRIASYLEFSITDLAETKNIVIELDKE